MAVNKEFVYKAQGGKDAVLYAGLLAMAHEAGLTGITTQIVQLPSAENGHTCICTAEVTMCRNNDYMKFTGIGDADLSNVKRGLPIIRMAETRAKARALRDAVNVGEAAFEEYGPDTEIAPTSHQATRRVEKQATTANPPDSPQLAVLNLWKEFQLPTGVDGLAILKDQLLIETNEGFGATFKNLTPEQCQIVREFVEHGALPLSGKPTLTVQGEPVHPKPEPAITHAEAGSDVADEIIADMDKRHGYPLRLAEWETNNQKVVVAGDLQERRKYLLSCYMGGQYFTSTDMDGPTLRIARIIGAPFPTASVAFDVMSDEELNKMQLWMEDSARNTIKARDSQRDHLIWACNGERDTALKLLNDMTGKSWDNLDGAFAAMNMDDLHKMQSYLLGFQHIKETAK